MDVKQAVAIAIDYAKKVFDDEKYRYFALEEVEFDESRGLWLITVGFSRPWELSLDPESLQAALYGRGQRTYKVVHVEDSSGKPLAIKNREVVAA